MPFEKGIDHPGKWKKGQSGNPAGKVRGTKNKLTTVKEAAERGEGLSPGEMLMEIARRNFAQRTASGDNIAMKAIIEANKYIEATEDAKLDSGALKDMTDEEINDALIEALGNKYKGQ